MPRTHSKLTALSNKFLEYISLNNIHWDNLPAKNEYANNFKQTKDHKHFPEVISVQALFTFCLHSSTKK